MTQPNIQKVLLELSRLTLEMSDNNSNIALNLISISVEVLGALKAIDQDEKAKERMENMAKIISEAIDNYQKLTAAVSASIQRVKVLMNEVPGASNEQ